MHRRAFALGLAILMAFFDVAATAQDGGTSEQLKEMTDRLAESIRDGLTNAESFNTNGFRVESSQLAELGADLQPNEEKFQLMSVTATGVFRTT